MAKQEEIKNPRITIFWYKPKAGYRFKWRYMKSTWQHIFLIPCWLFGVNIYVRYS